MTISVGILIVSDRCSRGEAEDKTTPLIHEWVQTELKGQVSREGIVPDEVEAIRETLVAWSDGEGLDVILTSGGTGFALRDVTPEATREVIHREAPGLPEAMRQYGIQKTPHAMLSRGIAGIRGRTLIVNLPGSPRAVRDDLTVILPALPHGVEILKGEHGANHRHEFKS